MCRITRLDYTLHITIALSPNPNPNPNPNHYPNTYPNPNPKTEGCEGYSGVMPDMLLYMYIVSRLPFKKIFSTGRVLTHLNGFNFHPA